MVAEPPTAEVAIVVAGGDPVDRSVAELLPARGRVIAADSGLEHALALGLRPDVVVGDMDSVDPDALADAERGGSVVVRHPAAKDATDLELAMAHARDEGHRRAVVVGGAGGRLSHLLGNAAVLASPPFADMQVEWHVGTATVVVVRPERPATVPGRRGDLVSLVPMAGPATGVSTSGLRWRLAGATLEPGSTRGISNEMTADTAGVTLRGGVLLAVHERIRP